MANLDMIRALAEQIISETSSGLPVPVPEPAPAPEPAYTIVKSMDELKKAIADGITDIRLGEGDWPRLHFDQVHPASEVRLEPLKGYDQTFPPISVRRSEFLTFSGFRIVNTLDVPPAGLKLASAGHDTKAIKFQKLECFATAELVEDHQAYRDWTKAEWLQRKVGGISMSCPAGEVSDCLVVGAYMAVAILGKGAMSRRNRVIGFPGDAYRFVADDVTSEDDYAQDGFQIDGNHSDVAQSWSIGADGKPGTGVRKGLVIRRLVARYWTLGDGSTNESRAFPQGIGLFDGMFEDLLIEDCDLDVGTYHGICVSGGKNVTIQRNKVWDHARPDPKGRRPWIMVADHKNGSQSFGSVVKDNLCQHITVDDPGAEISNNQKVF